VAMMQASEFYPLWWYGSRSERDRLHLVYDATAPLDIAQRAAVAERDVFPMQVEDFDAFLAGQTHFVGIGLRRELIERAKGQGFRVTPIGADGDGVVEASR